MKHSLLGPEFARELEALGRLFASRARSGGSGDRLGRRRGGSAEFQEHRDYDGDDLGRVDWLAFARTGQPKVKVFREDEDAIVRLAVDTSASMRFGSPPKLDFALRAAAAFGYLALSASERVSVLTLTDVASETATLRGRPERGRAALGRLLRQLEGLTPTTRIDLGASLGAEPSLSSRPGVLVLLSDFLDCGPIERALGRAALAGHDIRVVHVSATEELEPALEGDCTLVDAETGEERVITADGTAVAAYEARVAAHVRWVEGFTRKCRGSYVFCRSDEPLFGVMKRIVGGR
jgi:uncharacterized protein (DUF58 family)